MENRSIKKLVPKPSDAIQAMIDGLLMYDKKKNFRVDMDTYGMVEFEGFFGIGRYVCVGCAATCALQLIADKSHTRDSIAPSVVFRSRWLEFDVDETSDFECAIDDVRVGLYDRLFKFYDSYPLPNQVMEELIKFDAKPLYTENWREHLNDYKGVVRILLKYNL